MEVTRKISNFLKKIVEEHFEITKYIANQNLNYLWYIHKEGIKKNQKDTFMLIFCGELGLLVEMGYIKTQEADNIIKMLHSDDTDNHYVAFLTIKTLRNQRIKDHGEFKESNNAYNQALVNYKFYDVSIKSTTND